MGLLSAIGGVFGMGRKDPRRTPVDVLRSAAERARAAAPTAPGPTTTTTTAGGPPVAPSVNTAADQAAALQAGARAKKKAALGGIQMRPMPKPGTLSPRLQPKTLIGGY
jgi:hypothetical protein